MAIAKEKEEIVSHEEYINTASGTAIALQSIRLFQSLLHYIVILFSPTHPYLYIYITSRVHLIICMQFAWFGCGERSTKHWVSTALTKNFFAPLVSYRCSSEVYSICRRDDGWISSRHLLTHNESRSPNVSLLSRIPFSSSSFRKGLSRLTYLEVHCPIISRVQNILTESYYVYLFGSS